MTRNVSHVHVHNVISTIAKERGTYFMGTYFRMGDYKLNKVVSFKMGAYMLI